MRVALALPGGQVLTRSPLGHSHHPVFISISFYFKAAVLPGSGMGYPASPPLEANASPVGGIPHRLQPTFSSPPLRMPSTPVYPLLLPHNHGGAPVTALLVPGCTLPSGRSRSSSEQPFSAPPSSPSSNVLNKSYSLTALPMLLPLPAELPLVIQQIPAFQGPAQAPLPHQKAFPGQPSSVPLQSPCSPYQVICTVSSSCPHVCVPTTGEASRFLDDTNGTLIH